MRNFSYPHIHLLANALQCRIMDFMTEFFYPSRALQLEQRTHRLAGTVKGHWYSFKNMTWISCLVCSAVSFFLLACMFLWIAAGFFLTKHQSDLTVWHPDGYYGKYTLPINSCKFL